MGKAEKPRGPQVWRLQLGRRLRKLREAAGFESQDDLAMAVGWSSAKISRIESGRGTLTPAEVDKLLSALAPSADEVESVRKLAADARKRGSYGKVPDWAKEYVGMEAEADVLKACYNGLVPGPLQTYSYATAVLSTSVNVSTADVDRLARNRVRRHSILTREDPVKMEIVLGEEALRRVVGGNAVMREQVEHLREIALLPHVTFQVLPFSAGEHAALDTSFTLLYLTEFDAAYVYLEDLTSSAFWDRPPHTTVYEAAFARAQIAALGERATLSLLDETINNLAQ